MINDIAYYYHTFYDCYLSAAKNYETISQSKVIILPNKSTPTHEDFKNILLSWEEIILNIRAIVSQTHSINLGSLTTIIETIKELLKQLDSNEIDSKGAGVWLQQLQHPFRQYARIIKEFSDAAPDGIRKIEKDGNCFYSAVADQISIKRNTTKKVILSKIGNITKTGSITEIEGFFNDKNEIAHVILRSCSIEWIHSHANEFRSFLSEDQSLEEYLENARLIGHWADHLEIAALSQALSLCIIIVDLTNRHIVQVGNSGGSTIHLLYTPIYPQHYDSIADYPKIQQQLEKTKSGANASNDLKQNDQISQEYVFKIKEDGNCFFSAVAHQLAIKHAKIGIKMDDYQVLRNHAVNKIRMFSNELKTYFQKVNLGLKPYLENMEKDNFEVGPSDVELLSRAMQLFITIVDIKNSRIIQYGDFKDSAIHLLYTTASTHHYDSIIDYLKVQGQLTGATKFNPTMLFSYHQESTDNNPDLNTDELVSPNGKKPKKVSFNLTSKNNML